MKIAGFRKQHVKEAEALALADYERQQRQTGILPQAGPEASLLELTSFAENGLGVAAFEEDRMVGFLCCLPPFDHAFGSTDVAGVFSPMGAHGAIGGEPESRTGNLCTGGGRSRIYGAMYQAAAEAWVRAGAVSHGLCLYPHDREVLEQFYRYGFGLRCVDAIRSMEPVTGKNGPDYDFRELSPAEYAGAYPFHLAMHEHFLESPFFMNRDPGTLEEFLDFGKRGASRYFAAEQKGRLCACLELSEEGETCVASGPSYRHITGAFCLPEHRGRGASDGLLNFMVKLLRNEGILRLGVDFESINPAAWGFWTKHFTPYTYGVVRRIDERILNRFP